MPKNPVKPPPPLMRLASARDVVAKLGGPSRVGRDYGRSRQTVQRWQVSGVISPEVFLAMTTELRRRGYEASPALWGQA